MSYTKGPWRASIDELGASVEGASTTVCNHVSNEDAQLIAAAPEMLEALKAAREQMNDFVGAQMEYNVALALQKMAKAFEAAIAKATGGDK